jgi:hypothetical protein
LISPDAFYVSDEGVFVSSELTRGPWDPGAQHAGPPAALIARELERATDPDWQLGRITYEILRPVPIAPLRVEVAVRRPGRSVQLLSAALTDLDGEPLMTASAWRIATQETEIPPELDTSSDAVPGPQRGKAKEFFDTGQAVGYHTAMEYRFVVGGFTDLGPALVWLRPRHPLVAGEEMTPLQRVMIAADSGNGVSATLDLGRYIFINVDLSVHLHRLPQGEWIGLDAVTLPEPHGIGLADSVLHDERGPIGRALQTLLVRERQPARA